MGLIESKKKTLTCEFIAPSGEESPGNKEHRTSQKEGALAKIIATDSAAEIYTADGPMGNR